VRESEIIDLFISHFKRQGDIPLGDDAGALKLGDEWLIATNDMLVRKTDVPDVMTPEQVGFKVVTMNVSDVAAMGARPIGFLFSMGVPEGIGAEYLEGIARGMAEALDYYRIPVLSADTNEADDLVVDGIALGLTPAPVTRSGARPGDVVCLTGDVGRALAGYLVWKNGLDVSDKTRRVLYDRFLHPVARSTEGERLSGIATSAIDVSDGLSKELYVISRNSGVRIEVELESLPVREEIFEIAELMGIDPYHIVLGSGEEFELLFTVPPHKIEELGFEFTVIGVVKEGNGVYYRSGGRVQELPLVGWEHLSSKNGGIYRPLFR